MSATTTKTRTYDRDSREYDIQDLSALEEAGLATYFIDAGVWVVKTDHGSFAVRPHQVRDYQGEAERAAEQGYEEWLENGGPHAEQIAWENEQDRLRGGY